MRTIVGLGASETVLGIDKRPATGQIFIWTVPAGSAANAVVRTYTLDPATGVATLVGSVPGTVPGAVDLKTGFDFQPIVDRIRVVVSNNENFRINPNNAQLSGDDVNLTYSGITGAVIEVAYDRNVAPGPPGTPAPPGTFTTAYVISRGDSKLGLLGGLNGSGPGGPNGGTITSVGSLGITLHGSAGAGFDISGMTGIAYAALTTAAGPGLYTVNLGTGQATLVGMLPPIARVDGLTIMNPETTKPTGLLGAAPLATKRNLTRRTWKVRYSSDEAVTARSTLTGKVNGYRRTLGKGSASLGGAGIGKIGVTLTSAGRTLLSQMSHRIGAQTRKATFTVVLTDLAGNKTTLKASVTIRA
jgi:hypothetical protein